MRLRKFAAVVSAAALSLGMVASVSAHGYNPPGDWPCWEQQKCEQPSATASTEPTETASTEPSTEAPSTEPSTEAPSTEPTESATTEPSTEAPSTEPSTEAPSTEPSTEAPSTQPSTEAPSGSVEGLTSNPTLPPTDGLASGSQNGPDATLPLVLLILGTVGLAAVALTPARAKKR